MVKILRGYCAFPSACTDDMLLALTKEMPEQIHPYRESTDIITGRATRQPEGVSGIFLTDKLGIEKDTFIREVLDKVSGFAENMMSDFMEDLSMLMITAMPHASGHSTVQAFPI